MTIFTGVQWKKVMVMFVSFGVDMVQLIQVVD